MLAKPNELGVDEVFNDPDPKVVAGIELAVPPKKEVTGKTLAGLAPPMLPKPALAGGGVLDIPPDPEGFPKLKAPGAGVVPPNVDTPAEMGGYAAAATAVDEFGAKPWVADVPEKSELLLAGNEKGLSDDDNDGVPATSFLGAGVPNMASVAKGGVPNNDPDAAAVEVVAMLSFSFDASAGVVCFPNENDGGAGVGVATNCNLLSFSSFSPSCEARILFDRSSLLEGRSVSFVPSCSSGCKDELGVGAALFEPKVNAGVTWDVEPAANPNKNG